MSDGDFEIMASAIASGKSYEDTASICGVHVNTVYRRMKDSAFRDRVAEIRKACVEQTVSILSGAVTDASRELHTIATCSGVDSVRARACKDLLEMNLKYQERYSIEERLKKLEEIAGVREQAGDVGEAT